MSERTTAATWLKGIADMLAAEGLDVAPLLQQSGLSAAMLTEPDTRCPTESLSLLWELATRQSGNPALAVSMPHVPKPTCFDVVAYVMMSCPTLRCALERFIRYARIISNAAEVHLVEDKEGVAVTLDLYGGSRPIPRQRFEFTLVTHLTFFRWLTARQLQPIAVDFVFPPPNDLRPYEEAFQCPMRFDQPLHRIVLSADDVALPLPTSNPVLAELHDRYALERLDRLDHAKISIRARELIVRQLPDGEPLRGQIARALCMGERTLLRRLEEEGTSFNGLVDDTRRELAEKYLLDNRMALAQTAYLLGFSDQSALFRACKRWFGISPGEYRARQDNRATQVRQVPPLPPTPA